MKTLLRLTILLTGTITSLRAQGWTGGFKVGLGQGGFTGKSEFTWSASGMNFAAYFTRPLHDNISFQPELVVTEKVGQSLVGGSLLTFTGDEISAPMLLRYDFPQRRAMTPFVIGGPSVTFSAGCSLELVVAGVVSDVGCGSRPFLSRLELGLVAGGGLTRTIGAAVVSVEARGHLNSRSVAVPDGSEYAHGFGWAILAGASVPLRVLHPRRVTAQVTDCYDLRPPSMPQEAAGAPDATARGIATLPCRPRPTGAATP